METLSFLIIIGKKHIIFSRKKRGKIPFSDCDSRMTPFIPIYFLAIAGAKNGRVPFTVFFSFLMHAGSGPGSFLADF